MIRVAIVVRQFKVMMLHHRKVKFDCFLMPLKIAWKMQIVVNNLRDF